MNSIAVALVFKTIFFLVGECEMASQNPANSEDLQSALDSATAGDVITLLPIEYVGSFHISSSGSEGNLIILKGTNIIENGISKGTVVTNNGSGVIFDVAASFVRIGGMKIANANTAIQIKGSDNLVTAFHISGVQQAVVVNGDGNAVRACHIENLGDIAVHIQGNQNTLSSASIHGDHKGVVISGDHNTVKSCSIKSSDTGLTIEKGDDIKIKANTLSSLNISADSSGGLLSSTTIRGPFNLQGSKYTIRSVNAKKEVNIEGCDNEIESSSFKGTSKISSCNHFDSMSNSFPSLTVIN